ncbi:MAG: hypothetical protein AAFY99_05075 [Pseudomonadota bacterium]
MAKEFGRLALRQMDTAYERYSDALRVRKPKRNSQRLDENLAWASYFTLVITGAIHFAPEATASPIAMALTGIM